MQRPARIALGGEGHWGFYDSREGQELKEKCYPFTATTLRVKGFDIIAASMQLQNAIA